ncbi:MAG: FtsX-like permease family protein [Phycisphaerales bacterium]|nr:FtsX-like permease family protein [Phycisphaerales bacterium]
MSNPTDSVRPLTLMRITVRNLTARPMRTLLTAIGVSVGVVAIVAMKSITDGAWRSINNTIALGQSELLVFQGGVAADILSVLDEKAVGERLERTRGVAKAVGVLAHPMPVESQPFMAVYGVRIPNMTLLEDNVIEGRLPQSDDEVLAGAVALRALDRKIGDTIDLQGQDYTLVGVARCGAVFLDGALFASLPRVQEIAGRKGQVTLFQVVTEPGANVGELVERIDAENKDLTAIADASDYNKVDPGLDIAQGMIWGVSIIAILIGALIVMNTMWMSVLERTRQIGVLRAVGWPRRAVTRLILMESLGVGLVSCVLGVLGGVGLAELVSVMPVTKQFIDPAFKPGTFVIALLIAGALSVVGALAPAWRAAKVSPAEALRYE